MRRVAYLAIVAASLGCGFPYALDNRWWVVMACGLAGALWLLQSKYGTDLRPTVSLLFLAGVGCAGTYLNYNPVWLLTNLVVTLIAWDLDNFARDFQQFSMGQTRKTDEMPLVRAHLKRLGIVAMLGWSLGFVACNVQISLNFTGALILGLLALLSLRQVVRLLSREEGHETV
jgi:hypothetical protein